MKHFIRLSSRTSSYQRMAHVFNYRLQRLALAAVTYTIELAAYGFQLLLAAGPVQQLMKQFCLIQKQELPLPLAQRGLQRSGTGLSHRIQKQGKLLFFFFFCHCSIFQFS